MDEHATVLHAHVERRNFLYERRRRCTRFGLVLIAMPRTSDAAENNFAFAQRPVLMLADIGDSGDFPIVFENRHAFAGETNNASAVIEDVGDGAGVDEFFRSSRGNEALTRLAIGDSLSE